MEGENNKRENKNFFIISLWLMPISNFIFYFASNPWSYILSIAFIIIYTIIIFRPRYTIYNFTDEQWAVLYKMVEQGMIVIIRLEENKFQIIFRAALPPWKFFARSERRIGRQGRPTEATSAAQPFCQRSPKGTSLTSWKITRCTPHRVIFLIIEL